MNAAGNGFPKKVSGQRRFNHRRSVGRRWYRTPGALTTLSSRSMVQRAIANLLTNAIRHAAADSVVSLTVQRCSGAASLRVTKTGDVIAPDQLHRVFERFVRLDTVRGRSEGD